MKEKLSDGEAKRVFLNWPGRTNSVWPSPSGKGFWIRGQPKDGKAPGPTISAPGANTFHTQPDGLWVYFSQRKWCDIIAIEHCGTIQNLNDKRSRYIPSSHSLILNCTLKWLREEISVQNEGKKVRWKAAGTIKAGPKWKSNELTIPIRHLRVLYALANSDYDKWCSQHTPTGYEYFCRHSSLNSYTSKRMQSFLSQMSIRSQFYTRPKVIEQA